MGDYTAAAAELDSLCAETSEDHPIDDVTDADAVRARVQDLTRLAEMKWRYRVVEKGESAYDASMVLLERAKLHIDQHRTHVLATAVTGVAAQSMLADGASPAAGVEAAEAAEAAAAAEAFRVAWAPELSAVLHGLCVTRLIFETATDPCGKITAGLSPLSPLLPLSPHLPLLPIDRPVR